MTPAEEDALVRKFYDDLCAGEGGSKVIRLALRAAVAQERERAAKWHEDRASDLKKDKLDYMINDMRNCLNTCLLMIDAHLVSAAAIRRG